MSRKVFIDELPTWESGTNKGKANWLLCIGYKVKFIYDDIEGWVEIVGYEKEKKNYLTIKYENNILNIMSSSFIKCRIGKIVDKKTDKFKIKLNARLKDEKRDITITDMEYRPIYKKDGKLKHNVKWYKYTCNVCGWTEGWINEEHALSNIGCGCCCQTPRVLVQGINDIPTTNPEMICYFQGGYDEAKLYTKNGGGNPNNPNGMIYPICPDCGRVKDKKIQISKIYNRHSIGCSCGDGISYPNKFAFKMLKELNIDFISEYSPEWIKPRRYDFYIPSINVIVEMDGGLGHGKKVHNKSKVTSKESLEIDDYKDEQAVLHGIEVIRVDCELSDLEYIKQNILKSRLNDLYNFIDINWLKCNEYAVSNLVKIACKYKQDNLDLTCSDIGRIMNLSETTIRKYLKQGTEIWDWINYDANEEQEKSRLSISILLTKKVEIFKNNISLGVFESCSKLSDQSVELFGVKLLYHAICLTCRKNTVYKGFTFKYV